MDQPKAYTTKFGYSGTLYTCYPRTTEQEAHNSANADAEHRYRLANDPEYARRQDLTARELFLERTTGVKTPDKRPRHESEVSDDPAVPKQGNPAKQHKKIAEKLENADLSAFFSEHGLTRLQGRRLCREYLEATKKK